MFIFHRIYLLIGLSLAFLSTILADGPKLVLDQIVTKEQFLATYGINFVVAADLDGQELASNNSAVADECVQLLAHPSSVILMHANTFKVLANKYTIPQFHDQWSTFAYKHDRNILLCIPKILEPNPRINQDLGINLSEFEAVPLSIESHRSSSWVRALPKWLVHGPNLAFNQLIMMLYWRSNMVNAVQSLLLAQAEKKITVCLTGHGGGPMLGMLAMSGFPAYYFNKLLNTLERKNCIRALIYSTCYGGSVASLEDFYESRKYNFPIFCSSFDNSVSYFMSSSDIALCFEKLNKLALEKSHHEKISFAMDNYFRYTHMVNNIPHVRWAGETGFELLPRTFGNGVVYLSKDVGVSQVESDIPQSSSESIVNKLKYAFRTKAFYLIDQPVIDKKVVLPIAHALRVGTRKQLMHYIKELEIPSLSDIELLGRYTHCDDAQQDDKNKAIVVIDRLYYADSIKRVNKVILFLGDSGWGPKNSIYFEDATAQGFILDVKKCTLKKLSLAQKNTYNKYFELLKNQVLVGKGDYTESYLTKLHKLVAYQHPSIPLALFAAWQAFIYLIHKKNKTVSRALDLVTFAAILNQLRKEWPLFG